ncbi:MAG: hypothetical protein D8M57_01405 [Candidatus Scalindua sp. AMX11]|nr:MAG: hypothetical protein DWQ00_15385 [Candidatus Scalindua sp.]NOG85047.1 hypothetical protein [Planctomycetota bacterium]RZV93097.1 MAG: hypothetical protein EX341_04320 [Candidatus Scalindua sp. SCAELEC01]TDE66723.1 MAG: hypothetical protein D8M57_01405 [Candidatus Scalindua sp. AMX11]GJQ58031.1 MAG: hypothetical protein SCALA701_08320 [Candidatus Scalindua sp.]
MKKMSIITWLKDVCITVIISVITVIAFVMYINPVHAQYSQLFTIPNGQVFLDAVQDLAVDGTGNIYTTSGRNHIVKLSPKGEELFRIGTRGTGDGQFEVLAGVALDGEGRIYATDSRNNNIQKFDPDGNFLLKFGSRGSRNGQFESVSLITLDQSDNIYVSDSRNYRIQKFDSDSNFLMKFGTEGTGDGQFGRFGGPADIVLDSEGNIYVADPENHRIQKFDSNGNFLLKFGTQGKGDGQFLAPIYIALNGNGNINVVERSLSRVQKFDPEGNFLSKLEPDGSGRWDFHGPSLITFDPDGNLYLVDLERNRIQKFDPDGTVLAQFGTRGTIPGRFNEPSDIALDREGNIYVADGFSNPIRIQKLSPQGDFITEFRPVDDDVEIAFIDVDDEGNIFVAITPGSGDDRRQEVLKLGSTGELLLIFGSIGSGEGEIESPTDIAIGSDGNVYVADNVYDARRQLHNGRVQKFDTNGNFLSKIDVSGTLEEKPSIASGIELDSEGNIYITDTINNIIAKFDPHGNLLLKFGGEGSGSGEFKIPIGITVDSKGDLYVTDTENHRIQKFDSKGRFLSQFGSYGFEIGKFRYPRRSVVDRSGNVYVADTLNHRIQVFRPEPVSGDDFSDSAFGGTTSGTIADRGDQALTITDEPAPGGVRIKVDSLGGLEPAVITACGTGTRLTMDSGDEAVVTCGGALVEGGGSHAEDGSADIDVKEGTIDALFTDVNGFTASGSLPEGSAFTFLPDPFTLTAPSTNTDTVLIDITLKGREAPVELAPGQTVDLIVNDQISQELPVKKSFDSTPAPDAPKGTFTITATFTNRSTTPIIIPLFLVVELSGDNLLLNADGGPGGAGETVTPDLDNDTLPPGESMSVDFVIGLHDSGPFTLQLDLLGVKRSLHSPAGG